MMSFLLMKAIHNCRVSGDWDNDNDGSWDPIWYEGFGMYHINKLPYIIIKQLSKSSY